ncbi:helix-turn-helix domain-containing protein [Brumimicrobium aurantiacum]|uniref:Helicase n=1 Tax=Brumimicrobium aurantiacum TaxID=1737063 RepID=A0A3E1EXJ9_9FLAO|nr:helix-turn-helix domain-containing protein [Brumimicrobium aurantiacum]RFC54285.1 helicase [Brumimicrobium aurantiacum]
MKQITADIESPADFTEKFINQTNHPVFLTGKAGTGKTTLLKKIIDSTHKNTVVVAPTGIAALNAGGVTIHSFFQMPFAAFIPDFGQPPFVGQRTQFNTKNTLQQHFNLNKQRKSIFLKLELLIVDEVSMLRADLLDAMDFMLRKIRRNDTPYGGVQVLFIGDLMQLPPIVKREEKGVLDKYYSGSFFFHSKVVQEYPPLYIELEKIYRQNDPEFISLLNNLRNNHISDENVQLLNNYVKPDFDATEHEGFITLTTHNAKADEINEKALDSLKGRTKKYDAQITKKFPEHIYPIPHRMELKVGAQVMFIKNDLAHEKRYYNGKIGRVTELSSDEIRVTFPEENLTITVEPYEWENVKFSLDEKSGEIKEEVIGTFVHFPLKLAWAITVHKSQGLTFEKAVLDLSKVFAPGQAYVGLSRLVSLKGLVLTSPIQLNGLRNDQHVVNYAKNKADRKLLSRKLELGTVTYLQNRLQKTFNWDAMVSRWLALEASHKTAGPRSEMAKNKVWFEEQINTLMGTLDPARKFRSQIIKICQPDQLDIDLLYERYEAAYNYFIKRLEPVFRGNIKKLLLLGKKSNVKQYSEDLTELDEHLTEVILELKKSRKLVQNLYNGKALSKENIWDDQIRNFKIAKVQVVKDEIRRENPTIGDLEDFDTEKKTAKERSASKKPKESTFDKTYKLFQKGRTIKEIADERVLTEKTIYAHMSRLVKDEKIEVDEVLDQEKLSFLKETIGKEFEGTLSSAKEKVGDDISWEELKIYQASTLK